MAYPDQQDPSLTYRESRYQSVPLEESSLNLDACPSNDVDFLNAEGAPPHSAVSLGTSIVSSPQAREGVIPGSHERHLMKSEEQLEFPFQTLRRCFPKSKDLRELSHACQKLENSQFSHALAAERKRGF